MSGGYLDVLSLFEVPELARAPRFIGLGGEATQTNPSTAHCSLQWQFPNPG